MRPQELGDFWRMAEATAFCRISEYASSPANVMRILTVVFRYGLGVDLIEEYTLVLSNGTVKEVTTTSDNSLFNALKGSGNKVS